MNARSVGWFVAGCVAALGALAVDAEQKFRSDRRRGRPVEVGDEVQFRDARGPLLSGPVVRADDRGVYVRVSPERTFALDRRDVRRVGA